MFAEVKKAATIDTLALAPGVHIPAITTLYALIATLQEQVTPEDDALVASNSGSPV